MPHGVDSYYSQRGLENDWDKFDIGFLFGEKSVENWRRCSHWSEARPKHGMYNIGWPKSDFLFSDEFNEIVKKKSKEMGLSGKTIIYAPNREDHGKVHEFVKSSRPIADKVLIKHAPYDEGQYITNESLQDIYNKYGGCADIEIIDKNLDVFVALSLADVLVSDRSSVLQEAILTNTVPISVIDWPLGPTKGDERVHYKIPSFAVETSRESLENTIETVFNNLSKELSNLASCRDTHFSHLGEASSIAVDVIESVYFDQQPPIKPETPKTDNIMTNNIRGFIRNINNILPENARRVFRAANFDKLYDRIVYGGKQR